MNSEASDISAKCPGNEPVERENDSVLPGKLQAEVCGSPKDLCEGGVSVMMLAHLLASATAWLSYGPRYLQMLLNHRTSHRLIVNGRIVLSSLQCKPVSLGDHSISRLTSGPCAQLI